MKQSDKESRNCIWPGGHKNHLRAQPIYAGAPPPLPSGQRKHKPEGTRGRDGKGARSSSHDERSKPTTNVLGDALPAFDHPCGEID